ncbi:hypothetical protein NQ317_017352 [Molorchus minor]|uniref:Uncharacterized protein n=1 Tax=Molorchus minor TaxID=1323400 RepID=A0ABQ9ISI0_9CUCU|nr:hypothetical protein NQ317_017352 [Molorchus minor]
MKMKEYQKLYLLLGFQLKNLKTLDSQGLDICPESIIETSLISRTVLPLFTNKDINFCTDFPQLVRFSLIFSPAFRVINYSTKVLLKYANGVKKNFTVKFLFRDN